MRRPEKSLPSEAARKIADAVRGFEFKKPADLAKLLSQQRTELFPADYAKVGSLLSTRFLTKVGSHFLPEWLSNACVGLIRTSETTDICDPNPGIGLLLGNLAALLRTRNAFAVTDDEGELELGKRLLPALNWRCRKPLDFLRTYENGFDLIASFLPELKQPKLPKFVLGKSDRLADLEEGDFAVLVESALKLRTQGIGLYFVPESSLQGKVGLAEYLPRLGLFVIAGFKLPAGTFLPTSAIPLCLLVVSRRECEKVFFSEFTADPETNEQVLRNFHSSVDGGSFELGRMLTVAEFKGFDFLKSEERLEDLFSKIGDRSKLLRTTLERIAAKDPSPLDFDRQLVLERTGRYEDEIYSDSRLPKDFQSAFRLLHPSSQGTFEPFENSLFIPLTGNSPAVLSLEEMELRPSSYAQVLVDPKISKAGFVAKFLNSETGLAVRKQASQATKMSLTALKDLQIIIPSLEVQLRILEVEEKIARENTTVMALQNELDELGRKIRKNPVEINDLNLIEAKLESLSIRLNLGLKQRASESLGDWIETLPFPLASILRAWQARPTQDYRGRVGYLLHFFEATTHFISLILLGAVHSNSELFRQHTAKLNEVLNRQGLSYSRATFGTWKVTVEYLGRQTRELLTRAKGGTTRQANASELCIELFADSSLKLPSIISAKEIAAITEKAIRLRNDLIGHGGAIDSQADSLERNLTVEVERLRKNFDDLWNETQLIACDQVRKRQGRFESDIRILSGSNSTFLRETRLLSMCLDVDQLYLLGRESSKALKLFPLMRMCSSPFSEKNACYFFNRIESDGRTRMVSYHFATQPEMTDISDQVADAIKELSEPML